MQTARLPARLRRLRRQGHAAVRGGLSDAATPSFLDPGRSSRRAIARSPEARCVGGGQSGRGRSPRCRCRLPHAGGAARRATAGCSTPRRIADDRPTRSTCARWRLSAKRWRATPASPISRSRCRASAPGRSRCSAAPAQRSAWLPKTRSGKAIAAFALTEAGLRFRRRQYRDRREARRRRLRDRRREDLDLERRHRRSLRRVRAHRRAPGARGLSAFIVEGGKPGLSIAERIEVIAPHPLARLHFNNCRVPAERSIGAPGDGFKIAMATLDVFRATVGAAALGFARRALDETLARAGSRQLFGAPLGELQMVQGHIADMAVEIDAAALLVYRAAWTKDTGAARVTREAAMAKLYATEAAQRVIDAAVQIAWRRRRALRSSGRAALSRNPGAAHLRRRVRRSESRHRPVGSVSSGALRWLRQGVIRRSVRPRMSTPSRATIFRRSISGRICCSIGRNSSIRNGSMSPSS